MSTNNSFLSTRMEMNRTGVTFQTAIVDISTSIAQIFPLIHVKGRKSIISQVGTADTSYSTHCNGVLFTNENWKKRLTNEEYKCIPTQMKKLIGFAKAHGYEEQLAAFNERRHGDKKRKVSKVSHYGPAQDDKEDEMFDRIISKIAEHQNKNDSSSGDTNPVAPDASSSLKSNASAGATFGRQNSTGGKR